MAASSPPQRTSIPFYRDTRMIAIIFQVVFLIGVVGFLWFLYNNMIDGLRRSNLLPSFRFLDQPAGFPISESPIDFDPSMTYLRAIQVGILNTLRVAAIGIVVATTIGVILGVSRLSNNWLLRNVATVYVEIVRNIPLLLQLFFWLAITQVFPVVQQAFNAFGVFFFHNRGVTMAWPQATDNFGVWVPWLWIGLLAGAVFYGLRRYQFARRDRPGVAAPWAFLIAGLLVLIGFFVARVTTGGWPIYLEIPELNRFNFQGGVTLTTNFAALLMGLVIYTAVFIGEIVRSGIQAVSKGQREAARALGLTPTQTLRLVVFPQALRIMIPPLTSQYLNLTKNSSLAVAIGFPDLFSVAGTTLNQTGQAVPVIIIVMVSYLSISLLTSLLMNWYNKRIQLVER
ncbi:MAG: ABC transporter permease subunit [Oscillochloris sp.]|nr:ABC transporter permease subunit [Oscillochloris sp.]